jgi:hypothetical protein
MPRIFALRFGFEAIFAAIGFSGGRLEIVVGAAAGCVVVDLDCETVDPGVVLVVPDVDFIDLPTAVGLAGGTGLLTAVGFPVVAGLLNGLANAVGALRHAAAMKPSSLAESRIWHLQGSGKRKCDATPAASVWAQICSHLGRRMTVLDRS